METTTRLALPCIMSSQAQKHVTHNEALQMLDALVQLSVLDRAGTAPPPAPAEGDRHIVGPSAGGDWLGRDGQVAAWQDGAWAYFQPAEGWRAWVEDEQSLVLFKDGQWGPPGRLQNIPMAGINATADAVNRLVVAGEAVLLNHDGAGHQLKINKASAGDTASLLFQTGFSGRAEMGTAGADDFRFKVSGDGAAWRDAIVIDRDTGAVAFPNTQLHGGRERLSADRTYHVRTDGHDGNDGLANSSGRAFKTVQRALDVVYGAIDLGPHHVTIQLADGTYVGSVEILAPHVGSGTITLAGNAGAPGNTVIQRAAPAVFALAVRNYATLIVRDLEFNSASNTLLATGGGRILGLSNIRLSGNAGGSTQLLAQVGGVIEALTPGTAYAVVGNAAYHARATAKGQINLFNSIVDVTGRAFSGAFAAATRLSEVSFVSASFVGSATGKRYEASLNGIVFTNTGNPDFLPGNAAGTTATGGLYT